MNHDIPAGHVTGCQICGSDDLELVMDLGHQPPCDALLTDEQLNAPETSYPLRFMRCRECSLGQIDYVVPGDVVFPREYPYRSGITRELAEYQVAISEDLIERYDLAPGSLVVDIGSNDGTLLSGFRDRGMRVLGVEPTDIAAIARSDGIDTVQSFFTEELADDIARQHGKAPLVTSTNTFAHMAGLGTVVRGVESLLTDDGVFVTENHNLLDIVSTGQFDTIYHEHLRSYSLKSLIRLYDYYDFTVVHAQRVSRYAGNLRVHAMKGKGRRPTPAVAALLAEEEEAGLYDSALFDSFREKGQRAAADLLTMAMEARRDGKSFVGNSCPGRCSTLLNYAGITRDLMPYLAEQPTSLKLGLHLPGKHIPVVDNQILIEQQPDYVVLLAWHYAEPITKQLRARGLRSRFVMPLPEVRVIDD